MKRGDAVAAVLRPGHALLLVWPYSPDEAKALWAAGAPSSDAEALRLAGKHIYVRRRPPTLRGSRFQGPERAR